MSWFYWLFLFIGVFTYVNLVQLYYIHTKGMYDLTENLQYRLSDLLRVLGQNVKYDGTWKGKTSKTFIYITGVIATISVLLWPFGGKG